MIKAKHHQIQSIGLVFKVIENQKSSLGLGLGNAKYVPELDRSLTEEWADDSSETLNAFLLEVLEEQSSGKASITNE